MAAGWKQDEVMPTVTKKAVEWIAKQKGNDQPFFLYFPFTSPHAPIIPAQEFQGKSQAGPFGDYVHQTDWTCGQVLDALKANGLADNTIVIFTADNGPESFAYERMRKFNHHSTGPLRGLKRDIYEGGHRMPFVVRWPGVVEAGRVSGALVSQIDLMATIADAIGFKLPQTAADDSISQLPLLRGAQGSDHLRTSLVHNTNPNHYAIRQGDWVLIDAKTGTVSHVPPWFDKANGYTKDAHEAALYNLRDDLGEHENLIDKYPKKVAEMRRELQKIRAQQGRTP
jgi:arylsulfatase A